ncbi:small glutamine-rich tetratricopeptide repeat-containing protein [Cynara cardunculus var. scolymus]|uniref:small glutamine-rich tetratricopeptide repeat-containing protein n=1 Tax=Cynara cardunculus var. scolymus TaxID=59895 RepID=UPI000D624902|nr:small glutamine-rich tetratricopeptide repeat-containing protein [Cynara cardunculus var. scolymus]
MANLKADSPLCRRIVLSFLDFLNSVEPSSTSDVESLEVAKDCLSEAFKIDSSANRSVAKSDSLVQIFSSQTGHNEIKSDQIHEEYRPDTSHTSCTNNTVDTKIPATPECLDDIGRQDTRTIGVREDELFGQFFGALEKIHYFGSTANGDDEQALDRTTHLFHNALMEMKKSGCEEIDLKNLADTFKVQGNKAMQSKIYSEAIELYTIAIALRDDNAVYYCNRAAAYTQTKQYTEATCDCHQAIAIDPNYSKAYSRLGFTYYAQGNYRDAIAKGFMKALQLDPNNESIRGNIQAAEQKLKEEQQRAQRGQSSGSGSHSNQEHSGGGSRSHASVPPFTSMPFNVNGHPFDFGSMLRDMGQGRPGGSSNPTDEPGPRIGVNVGDQVPEEFYGTIRSVMQMFSDGTAAPHVNSQNNSNGN